MPPPPPPFGPPGCDEPTKPGLDRVKYQGSSRQLQSARVTAVERISNIEIYRLGFYFRWVAASPQHVTIDMLHKILVIAVAKSYNGWCLLLIHLLQGAFI